jgi:hypothetical protein
VLKAQITPKLAPPFGTTPAEGSNLTKIVGTTFWHLFSPNFLSLSPTFHSL